jgi:hypothetical protein
MVDLGGDRTVDGPNQLWVADFTIVASVICRASQAAVGCQVISTRSWSSKAAGSYSRVWRASSATGCQAPKTFNSKRLSCDFNDLDDNASPNAWTNNTPAGFLLGRMRAVSTQGRLKHGGYTHLSAPQPTISNRPKIPAFTRSKT